MLTFENRCSKGRLDTFIFLVTTEYYVFRSKTLIAWKKSKQILAEYSLMMPVKMAYFKGNSYLRIHILRYALGSDYNRLIYFFNPL